MIFLFDFIIIININHALYIQVNDEIILQKWKEAKDNNTEFDVDEDTATGNDVNDYSNYLNDDDIE